MKRISIVLAQEHRIFRDLLRLLINRQRDLRVVGEATHGKEALVKARALQPQVLVMDSLVTNDGGSGIGRQLRRAGLKTRVVTLIANSEWKVLNQASQAQIRGFVKKQSGVGELLAAIRRVAKGDDSPDPSPECVRVAHHRERSSSFQQSGQTILSDRENEVLRLIAFGHTSKEVAAQLEISIKSVETYKARLRAKLGVA